MTDKKRVLITGGAGFIGGHLIELLLQDNNYQITVIDQYPPRQSEVKFIKADFHDHETTSKILRDIDIVVHLAAMVGVDKCRLNPEKVYEVNDVHTKEFIDLCIKQHIKRFIFSSSSEVYGNSKAVPYKEDAALDPISDYAKCKVEIEKYLAYISEQSDLTVGIVRFFNIYGPGQKNTFVVPIFLEQVLANKPITILGDGSQTRCFTYVKDAVKGVKKLIEYASKYDIFNIGNPKEFTIKQLAELILKLVPASRSEIIYQSYGSEARDASLEILRRVPNSEKAKDKLSFTANTPLAKGLQGMIPH